MSKEFSYSFIIPHKNSPDLLQRCVDSIPERDDVQVIVIDDNSDADKKPSLKERKNLQVKLLDAEHSKGAGRARNEGLKHAKGKWLLFADADDYYTNGFMEILDSHSNQDLDVVYFNFLYKDGKTGRDLSQPNIQSVINEFDGTKAASDKIKFLYNVPWNKMILHDYVRKYHFYFEEVPNGNDIFFSKCVGYHTENIIVDKRPVYVYIKNENSIVTSTRSIEGEICRIRHQIKQNYFFDFVGLSDWKKPVLKGILLKTRSLGLPFFRAVVRTSAQMFIERKEWVNIISLFKNLNE